MPELPEVETVLRTLEHQLNHPVIENVEVYWTRIIAYPDVDTFIKQIKGRKILAYERICVWKVNSMYNDHLRHTINIRM